MYARAQGDASLKDACSTVRTRRSHLHALSQTGTHAHELSVNPSHDRHDVAERAEARAPQRRAGTCLLCDTDAREGVYACARRAGRPEMRAACRDARRFALTFVQQFDDRARERYDALTRDATRNAGSDVVEMRPATGKNRPIVETVLLEPGETFVGTDRPKIFEDGEGPARRVRITKTLEVDVHECTNEDLSLIHI